MTTEPWAIVAHKDGRFGGVISPVCGKRAVAKFCEDFISRGYTMTPLPTQTAYSDFLDTLKIPESEIEQEQLVFAEPVFP
jgi:hypothetical protein